MSPRPHLCHQKRRSGGGKNLTYLEIVGMVEDLLRAVRERTLHAVLAPSGVQLICGILRIPIGAGRGAVANDRIPPVVLIVVRVHTAAPVVLVAERTQLGFVAEHEEMVVDVVDILLAFVENGVAQLVARVRELAAPPVKAFAFVPEAQLKLAWGDEIGCFVQLGVTRTTMAL